MKVDAYTSPPSREGCAPVSPEKVSPRCLTVLTSWLLADGSPPGSEGGWEFNSSALRQSLPALPPGIHQHLDLRRSPVPEALNHFQYFAITGLGDDMEIPGY